MAASMSIVVTIITASLVALAQADAAPRMDKVLETTDRIGRLYYELETEWVQDKKTNCAHDAGVVERILAHRDRGGSLGEVLIENTEERYYIRIAVNHWNDDGTARDTASGLYRYCIDKGTYWSPLGPLGRKKG
ncbi:MAG: hypothetical protein ABFS24_03135 [Pseudomonadota bacterium]